ncbi:MAG: HEAT repeat domain-containing protein, partial [Bacteroidota bacterium]
MIAAIAAAIGAEAFPARAENARVPALRAAPLGSGAISDREAHRDTTGLAHALRNGTVVIRAQAARALGRIQNRGSVPALTAALQDRAAAVRHEAAFALALVGDSTAAPAIAARLPGEPDPTVRATLVTALGYIGARRQAP